MNGPIETRETASPSNIAMEYSVVLMGLLTISLLLLYPVFGMDWRVVELVEILTFILLFELSIFFLFLIKFLSDRNPEVTLVFHQDGFTVNTGDPSHPWNLTFFYEDIEKVERIRVPLFCNFLKRYDTHTCHPYSFTRDRYLYLIRMKRNRRIKHNGSVYSVHEVRDMLPFREFASMTSCIALSGRCIDEHTDLKALFTGLTYRSDRTITDQVPRGHVISRFTAPSSG